MKGKWLWCIVLVVIFLTGVLSFKYIQYLQKPKSEPNPSRAIRSQSDRSSSSDSNSNISLPENFIASVDISCKLGDFSGEITKEGETLAFNPSEPAMYKGVKVELTNENASLYYLGVKIKEIEIPEKYNLAVSSLFNALDNKLPKGDNIDDNGDTVKISYEVSGKKFYCIYDKKNYMPNEINLDGIGNVKIKSINKLENG